MFDNVKVGPDLARLQRAFARQIAEAADSYIASEFCPVEDGPALRRFRLHMERLANCQPEVRS